MTRSELEAAAAERFRERFGAEPERVGSAPGRVNLIGEHVDYVGGLVLPMAIDRYTAVALGPAEAWDDELGPYIQAAGRELGSPPQRGAIASSVPIGAGVSSSAALLVAAARALAPALGGVEAAQLCQRAEQAATGVQVGIMDQFASALGRAGHALLLDCGSLEHVLVPFPEGLLTAVIDSGVSRRLADTPYNERRREAIAAVEGSVADPRRLRHVLTEGVRTGMFAAAMAAGDAELMGALLSRSHRSLRDDFEVSTPELDAVVAAAEGAGALGARLMGAGFGGSVLALVPAGADRAPFEASVARPVLWCSPADGAFVTAA